MVLFCLLSALGAAPALAEGARIEIACDFVTACDAAGACAGGQGPVEFTLSPQETGPDGGGSYSVSVDGAAAIAAQGLSFAGPFLWSPSADTRQVLVLTTETTGLWIRQVTGAGTDTPPSAEIDLMSCEVTA